MRLSRIVCASLFSVAIASSAYADLEAARNAYNGNDGILKQQEARLKAADILADSISKLKSVGYASLTAYDKDSATDGVNKTIKDAINAVTGISGDTFSKLSTDITVTSAPYGDSDANTIKLVLHKGEANPEIKLTITDVNSGNEQTLTSSTDKATFAEIFASSHKDAFLDVLSKLDNEVQKRKTELAKDVESKKLAYAQELGSSDSIADDDRDFVINNESYIQNALNKKISDANTAVATAQAQKAKEDAAKAAIAAAFEAYKADSGKTDAEKQAALDAANAALKATGKTLTNANAAGNANVTGDGETKFVAADFANDRKATVEGTYDAVFTAAAELEAAKTTVSTAKTAQGNHASALLNVGDNSLVKSYKDKLNPETAGTPAKAQATAAEALKTAQAELETALDNQAKAKANYNDELGKIDSKKVSFGDKNNIDAVKAKLDAIEAAKALPQDSDADKVAKLKRALEGGVILKDGNGKLYQDNDSVDEIQSDTSKLDELLTVADLSSIDVSQAKTAAETLEAKNGEVQTKQGAVTEKQNTLAEKNKELATATTNYNKAKAARLSAISANKANSASDKSVVNALADLTSNTKADELASKTDADTVASIAKSVATSADEAKNSLNKGVSVEVLTFNNDLATNTRLAKLSNPFNDELALASAIKNLESDKFADNGDSISSVVKGYTDRYNYDNNLWGTIIGAKGKIKDSANPEVYGVTIGYDRAFDNTIAGGFLSYAKSDATGSLISNKADNYQIGAYARTFVQNHEIDVKLSLGTAKNTLERKDVVGSYDAKYDTLFTSLDATYGYVIDAGDSLYVKPLVGLGYSYAKNDSFEEKNGALPLKYSAQKTSIITAKLGVDIRKYLENGNYVYVAPSIESELYKSKDKLGITFVGSNKEFVLTANDKKNTFFVINTGVEAKLTDALSTNVNLGTKLGSKEQYISGSVGLRYKF